MPRVQLSSLFLATCLAGPASAATVTVHLTDQNNSGVGNAVVYALPLQANEEASKQSCAGKIGRAHV